MPLKSFNIYEQINSGVIEKIKRKKQYALYFVNPVNVKDYPDYLNHVKKPMAITTLKENLLDKKYATIADFEADMLLISSNCRQYNPPHHFLQPIALEFEKDAKSLIEDLRKNLAKKGLDPQAPLASMVLKSESSSLNHSGIQTPHKIIPLTSCLPFSAPSQPTSQPPVAPSFTPVESAPQTDSESKEGGSSGFTQIVPPQIPSLSLSIGQMTPEEKATEYVGRNVITQLKKCKTFEMYFFGPVNTQRNPDYLKIISRPTCLRDIRDKLQSRALKTLPEFLEELDLIVANARKYNPAGHWIHQIVDDFETSYQHFWNVWLDKLVQYFIFLLIHSGLFGRNRKDLIKLEDIKPLKIKIEKPIPSFITQSLSSTPTLSATSSAQPQTTLSASTSQQIHETAQSHVSSHIPSEKQAAAPAPELPKEKPRFPSSSIPKPVNKTPLIHTRPQELPNPQVKPGGPSHSIHSHHSHHEHSGDPRKLIRTEHKTFPSQKPTNDSEVISPSKPKPANLPVSPSKITNFDGDVVPLAKWEEISEVYRAKRHNAPSKMEKAYSVAKKKLNKLRRKLAVFDPEFFTKILTPFVFSFKYSNEHLGEVVSRWITLGCRMKLLLSLDPLVQKKEMPQYEMPPKVFWKLTAYAHKYYVNDADWHYFGIIHVSEAESNRISSMVRERLNQIEIAFGTLDNRGVKICKESEFRMVLSEESIRKADSVALPIKVPVSDTELQERRRKFITGVIEEANNELLSRKAKESLENSAKNFWEANIVFEEEEERGNGNVGSKMEVEGPGNAQGAREVVSISREKGRWKKEEEDKENQEKNERKILLKCIGLNEKRKENGEIKDASQLRKRGSKSIFEENSTSSENESVSKEQRVSEVPVKRINTTRSCGNETPQYFVDWEMSSMHYVLRREIEEPTLGFFHSLANASDFNYQLKVIWTSFNTSNREKEKRLSERFCLGRKNLEIIPNKSNFPLRDSPITICFLRMTFHNKSQGKQKPLLEQAQRQQIPAEIIEKWKNPEESHQIPLKLSVETSLYSKLVAEELFNHDNLLQKLLGSFGEMDSFMNDSDFESNKDIAWKMDFLKDQTKREYKESKLNPFLIKVQPAQKNISMYFLTTKELYFRMSINGVQVFN